MKSYPRCRELHLVSGNGELQKTDQTRFPRRSHGPFVRAAPANITASLLSTQSECWLKMDAIQRVDCLFGDGSNEK